MHSRRLMSLTGERHGKEGHSQNKDQTGQDSTGNIHRHSHFLQSHSVIDCWNAVLTSCQTIAYSQRDGKSRDNLMSFKVSCMIDAD